VLSHSVQYLVLQFKLKHGSWFFQARIFIFQARPRFLGSGSAGTALHRTWNWVSGSTGQWVICVIFHDRVINLTRCETRVFSVFEKKAQDKDIYFCENPFNRHWLTQFHVCFAPIAADFSYTKFVIFPGEPKPKSKPLPRPYHINLLQNLASEKALMHIKYSYFIVIGLFC